MLKASSVCSASAKSVKSYSNGHGLTYGNGVTHGRRIVSLMPRIYVEIISLINCPANEEV